MGPGIHVRAADHHWAEMQRASRFAEVVGQSLDDALESKTWKVIGQSPPSQWLGSFAKHAVVTRLECGLRGRDVPKRRLGTTNICPLFAVVRPKVASQLPANPHPNLNVWFCRASVDTGRAALRPQRHPWAQTIQSPREPSPTSPWQCPVSTAVDLTRSPSLRSNYPPASIRSFTMS